MCGFAYAAYRYWGGGSAEGKDFEDITRPFETSSASTGQPTGGEARTKELQASSSSLSGIITDYSNIYCDASAPVELDGRKIPSIYFSPSHMIIFTRSDGQGWTLNKGNSFTLNFTLDERQSLTMETGYVVNGEYHTITPHIKGIDFSETVTADQDGTYYFCVTNLSSENAVIVDGTIIS